jgi:tripartite-type tricarboxylate transporter receptor subunit TctC
MRLRDDMGTTVRRVALALLMTVAAVHAAAAQSASWPDRPIHLIVPFPAGSSSDIVARIVAQKLGERLGQQLVVENRPGASGNLGTEAVAHAAADGYTLGLANTSTHTLSPSLMAKPTYDPVKDFVPISMIGASPFVLALYPDVPATSVQELVSLAKTNAKTKPLTFASAGPATLANLAGVLFAKTAHIELTPVSYRGSGQEILDVVAGRVDMAFATIPPTLPLIRDGKVRAIAVTGPQRSPALVDVPTVAESGLPSYESVLWQALYAPVGTPAAIVTRLNAEVNAILRDSDAVGALAKLGVEAQPSTPQQFADRIAADLKKWHDVIVSAGIQPQ